MKPVYSLLLVSLIGCAASQLPPPGADSGNYLRKPPGELESVMAVDAADQLYRLYQSDVRFQVLPPHRDAFGTKFVAELSGHGYSVLVGGTPGTAKELRYRVQDWDDGLFTAIVRIDDKRLSRGYRCAGEQCLPAGPWTVATGMPRGRW